MSPRAQYLRLFFALLFLLFTLTVGEIDESVLAKDLYAVLGLTVGASPTDIKKSYRELARKFHPDKAKNEKEKVVNEGKFPEIAEAYELLSNDNLRSEYDHYRQFMSGGHGRVHGHGPPPGGGGDGGMFMFEDGGGGFMFHGQAGGGEDIFDMFEGMFEGGVGGEAAAHFMHGHQHQHHHHHHSHQDEHMMGELLEIFLQQQRQQDGGGDHHYMEAPPFQPTATESPLRSNEIITPFSPIITTADQSHYAFLDATCAFKVYSYRHKSLRGFLSLMSEHPVLSHAKGVRIML
jgi:curved DNA-binding protein CbpA